MTVPVVGGAGCIGSHTVQMLCRPATDLYGDNYDTLDGTRIRATSTSMTCVRRTGIKLLGGGESGRYNLGNGNGFSAREVIETARCATGPFACCPHGSCSVGWSSGLIVRNRSSPGTRPLR